MNIKIKLSFLLAAVMSVTAAAQNGPDLLQQALRKERVDGDLKGAIELYQQIVKEHAANRALAAQALVQMGKDYERLGDTEARAAYEKVISEFADQTREVTEARARLDTLDGENQSNGADGQPLVWQVASDKLDHWVAFGDATPSPDGRYLAYVNWTHGNLALCDLKTRETKDLTHEGTWNWPDQYTFGGVWSPDGTQIAYLWMHGNDGDLRIIHRDGGTPRILVPLGKGGRIVPQAWSKDGRFILATSFPAKTEQSAPANRHQILRVDVATGNVQVVTEFPGPSAWIDLTLSPDGTHIAYDFPGVGQLKFLGQADAPNQIRIVNIDGSNDHVLIDHPSNDRLPCWMPDGQHLLFLSDRTGANAIWAVPTHQGAITGDPRLVRDGITDGPLLKTSGDGTVYFYKGSPSYNIFVAEADFTAAKMETPKLVSLRYDGKNQNPRWSSDGSRLGYVSMRTPPVLVVQDRTSGKETEVEIPGTANNKFRAWPRPQWSPDLSYFVGVTWEADRNDQELHSINVKTGQRTKLDINGPAHWGVMSPDGHHLIYESYRSADEDPRVRITELDLRTHLERIITDYHHSVHPPIVLSFDGSRLVYCDAPYPAKKGETTKLMVASMVDGTATVVCEFPYDADEEATYPLDWLPDNRYVLVSVTDKEGIQRLDLVDTETGKDRVFGEPLRGADRIKNLSVHPDGKRVAFSRGRDVEEIWAMKNFLPEETQAAK